MRLLLILPMFITVHAGIIKEECDGLIINNVYHDVEILHEDLDKPYLLATDYSTNTLYFSYSIQADDDESKSARINLNTKEFNDIKGVNDGFAQTVDQETHDIYIGGSDGIYIYDYESNTAEFLGEKDVNIWNLYFKDVLYYSVYPSQFLYTYIDGQSTRFKDLEDTKVDIFVIDGDDFIFFTNATGLYSQKIGTKDATLYKNFTTVGIRGLTTDLNGKVYACLQDGIYAVDKTTLSVELVVKLENAFGVAFDNVNNMVYSDATKLVRLKPNEKKTC